MAQVRRFAPLLFLAQAALAADLPYSERVSDWVTVPDYAHRNAAANRSRYEWIVARRDGQVVAQLDEHGLGRPVKLPFQPVAKGHSHVSDAIQVSDGWLVAFNDGEFGAAVFWFDDKGSSSYQVSDHQVVSFQTLADTIFAVEGLAHLGISRGSFIKLVQAGNRWQAQTVAALPHAPYAATTREGRLLVVADDALLEVAPDGKQKILLKDAPWELLFPNSTVLSADSKTLYIGMRQYVAEVRLANGAVRMLVPSKGFL